MLQGMEYRNWIGSKLKINEEFLYLSRADVASLNLTDEVITAAKTYDPARITHFVIELATLFHKFYNAQRVIADDEGLMQARLYLCIAVKDTIKNILTMLKISVPESM